MKFQVFLYDVGIFLYATLIRLAAPFNKKAKARLEGSRNWELRCMVFLDSFKQNDTLNPPPPIPNSPIPQSAWFHCASLGEFEQGRPVIEAFRQRFPNYTIILTFFSPSGYEVKKNYAGADFICYLPLDTPKNAQAFVNAVNPSVVFFIKYEFWYHYSKVLAERQIPIYSISSIFRPNQLFFRWYGGLQRQILQRFSHFFVQNQSSVTLLQSIGIEQVSVLGDTRFDRVFTVAQQAKSLPLVESFLKNAPVLVVGSAWPEDFEVIRATMPALQGLGIKVIIAPHEIHEKQIEEWRKALKTNTLRYSELTEQAEADVMIIDNIGMLSSLYRYATFAWIGGAYGKGLHNILEAATFGMPIFFGDKKYQKFKEATDLLAQGSAFAIKNSQAFEEKLRYLTQNEIGRQALGTLNRAYVAQNTGATELIMKHLIRVMSDE